MAKEQARRHPAAWVSEGARVVAETAQGRPHAVGRVVACTDQPTVLIRTDDGRKVSWIAALCREVAVLPDALAETRAAATGWAAAAADAVYGPAAGPAGDGPAVGECRNPGHGYDLSMLESERDELRADLAAAREAAEVDRAALVERFAELIPDYYDDGNEQRHRALAEHLVGAVVDRLPQRRAESGPAWG